MPLKCDVPLLLSTHQVSTAEGFGKVRLFEILDDLETKTRPIMVAARKALAEAKGSAALEPHNISYALTGDTEKVTSPSMLIALVQRILSCTPLTDATASLSPHRRWTLISRLRMPSMSGQGRLPLWGSSTTVP